MAQLHYQAPTLVPFPERRFSIKFIWRHSAGLKHRGALKMKTHKYTLATPHHLGAIALRTHLRPHYVRARGTAPQHCDANPFLINKCPSLGFRDRSIQQSPAGFLYDFLSLFLPLGQFYDWEHVPIDHEAGCWIRYLFQLKDRVSFPNFVDL